jgi:hypothetical protein
MPASTTGKKSSLEAGEEAFPDSAAVLLFSLVG